MNIINYAIFNKQKPMGTQHTVGFVAHHVIYGLVWVLPRHGYSHATTATRRVSSVKVIKDVCVWHESHWRATVLVLDRDESCQKR